MAAIKQSLNAEKRVKDFMDDRLLKNEERAVFSLRALYKKYGYLSYKMSKFEEYDFYVRNKDFLVSDRIITFNDTNGKLLALKPDVTLSIIKNGQDVRGCKQKVFYNENVYRVSGRTHQYKEILQTGLECIGEIDAYDLFEVVSLAAQSLAMVSKSFVLEISHLGILEALLNESGGEDAFRREVTHCVAEKNTHDLRRVCKKYGISVDKTETLCDFIGIYGDRERVIDRLSSLCQGEEAKKALSQLRELSSMLQDTAYTDRILFDFSIVNDMNYYNGIVFKGFLNRICEGVLAGGQYDKLMRRMGRKSGAIGFALYLDLLEDLKEPAEEYDVDVLLLYSEAANRSDLAKAAEQLLVQGKSVSVQKAIPPKLRYRELVTFEERDAAV